MEDFLGQALEARERGQSLELSLSAHASGCASAQEAAVKKKSESLKWKLKAKDLETNIQG